MMPEYHATVGAALRPVPAGHVLATGERSPIGLRPGEHVVGVGGIATAVDDRPFLGESRLLGEVVRAVQLVDILGDDLALGVPPRAAPDPIARIHRTRTLRAEICAPLLPTGADRARERLTLPVGALQATEIRALARPNAGDEERHVGGTARGGRLGLRSRAHPQQGNRGKQTHYSVTTHRILPGHA